ncbi:MAG: hypothetical protein QOJ81_537 [Chloroflexota bacterium]|jgi:hypothetical protein|nr:hypothetical protein [Chloroflexota bacterium]
MAQRKQFQGEPGQVVSYGGVDGATHTLKADDDGVLTARSAGDEAMLESFGLSAVKKEAKKDGDRAGKKES